MHNRKKKIYIEKPSRIMQAHHETSTVVGKDIQAPTPCSRWRETPLCAGDSHFKQTSGVAERFEFIHPR